MKLWMTVILCGISAAQDTAHQHTTAPASIPLQPLAQQVRQLEEAMTYLGQPFGDGRSAAYPRSHRESG